MSDVSDSIFVSGKALTSPVTNKIPQEKLNLDAYNQTLQTSSLAYKQWSWVSYFDTHTSPKTKYKSFKGRFWITSIHCSWGGVETASTPYITLQSAALSDILEIWQATSGGGGDISGTPTFGNDHIYFNPPLEINPNEGDRLAVRFAGDIVAEGASGKFFVYGFEE